MGSCDGHERRFAYVMLTKDCNIKVLNELFLALGMKRVKFREHRNHYLLRFWISKNDLLDFVEKLSQVNVNWLGKGVDFISEQLFYAKLEQLLMIPGVSGSEGKIREFVMKRLKPFVDYIIVDHAGNVLAEKTYRKGDGPTILLNAYLDTVYEIDAKRRILKDDNIWSISKGILGADDRAGVAVILHVVEQLSQSSFNGKVKIIFSVEEERGLIGVRQVNEYFLWGTDAAIVVDRRGSGDIVTSYGDFLPFCESEYGAFFEKVANEEGLSGWATTVGGSSDTRIWAEHGIQSVNLSVGYSNEPTDEELLDVAACYQTTKLVNGIFKRGNELRKILRNITSVFRN